jgi:sugar phosphate isomerase/epimerase
MILETLNVGFLPEGGAEGDDDALRPDFELAKELGARVITGAPPIEKLAVLENLAEEYDMKVGIHNHGPGGILSDMRSIRSILHPHGPRIGLCVDTGHYLRLPLDPLEVMKAFADRVHAVHLRDMNPDRDPIRGDGGKYVEFTVGQGPLDLQGTLGLLLAWEYQGTIALEYKPNPDDPMPNLRTALRNIEEALVEL